MIMKRKLDVEQSRLPTKILSQEVISNCAVQALSLRRICEVSGLCGLNKLTVIPASDLGTICPPVRQVWGEIRSYSDPQQGGESRLIDGVQYWNTSWRRASSHDKMSSSSFCSQTVRRWWHTTKEKKYISWSQMITFCGFSVDKTLVCDHLNESYWAVLSCGTVYYAVQGGSNF